MELLNAFELFLLCTCVLLQLATSESSTVYRFGTTASADKTGDYIISVKDGVSSEDFQNLKNYVESLSDDHKIHSSGQGLVANFITAKISHNSIEMIRQLPEVNYIEEETVGHSDQASFHVDRIDQVSLPFDGSYNPINHGEGVDIYILDSGINYDHNEFGGRALYSGYDPTDDHLKGTVPSDIFERHKKEGKDCSGHGTHVASLAGGNKYGAANGTRLYSVRVLDCSNKSPISVILNGLNHVIEKVPERNRPAVVSMSLNYELSPALNDALRRIYESGIPIVGAGGNGNHKDACFQEYPAASIYSIAVGSSTRDDGLSDFTDLGPCIDLFAPGSFILAASSTCNQCTEVKSGTSSSAPLVSGTVAIMLSQNPYLTPAEIREGLVATSSKDKLDFSTINSNSFLWLTTPNRLLFTPPRRSCNGTFYATGVSSIIRPTIDDSTSKYLPNMNCKWTIVAPTGSIVILYFPWAAVEENYDHIRICDGSSCIDSEELDDLSGIYQSRQYISSGQYLTIEMTTDSSVNGDGFEASYYKFLLGIYPSSPASSCSEVSSKISGMYWIRTGSGSAIRVYCEFN